jgi:chromate reductase, NAD(P)H dehydrogenase (quinone)
VLAAAGADVLDDELPIGSAHEVFDENLTLADPELSARLEHMLAGLLTRAVKPMLGVSFSGAPRPAR